MNEVQHTPSQQPPRKSGLSNTFRELLHIILIALFVVLPIRIFIAQPFVVSGSSMVPTFENGDYLIVDQVTYRLEDPERFDVIIFKYPKNPSKYFIKRIIGLPGETIKMADNDIRIFNSQYPDEGIRLTEPYVQYQGGSTLEVTLENDEYFVMGDNRAGSSDSRVWGPLEKSYIIGRAFTRLLPIAEAEFYPGEIPDSKSLEDNN